MKILIDENLPRKLIAHLAQDWRTVAECGWAGKKNCELLALVDGSFDLLTIRPRQVVRIGSNAIR
jgi:hypothetical protein